MQRGSPWVFTNWTTAGGFLNLPWSDTLPFLPVCRVHFAVGDEAGKVGGRNQEAIAELDVIESPVLNQAANRGYAR
jgi:hypothetical protein